jgi:hypothetical protein
MDQWTTKVTTRRQIAELLLKQPERIRKAKLLPRELQVIIDQGQKAEQADAEQREQLTAGDVDRSAKSASTKSLFARETELRNVMAAVVDDLRDEAPALAELLARLSFARFRIRELAAEPAMPTGDATPETTSRPEDEEIRSVERVELEDHTTRARNLGRYCRALLKPGREPIVGKLAEREITREEIEKLAADAEAQAEAGRNVKRAAEATAREAAAVAAQKRKWNAVRRLVAVAARGDRDLEAKLAEC